LVAGCLLAVGRGLAQLFTSAHLAASHATTTRPVEILMGFKVADALHANYPFILTGF
jgi:hypothetical protein